MTRSSTSELFTPYKEPEREFQSSRRHFKTLSLNESRSPDFNLFSDQEDSEEEEVETMAETMEQYMSKTRTDNGSGELRTNTFSGSDHEDANEHIEKVLEIVDLFHIPNITTDQVMLRAFPMSLTGAASRWLRMNRLVQLQLGGGYRAAAPGFYQRNNVNPSYQERRKSMEDTLSKFMSESVKRHEENSNLIKEIRALTEAAIQNQGASIKTLEIQIGQMSTVLHERGFGSLPSSTEVNPRDQVKSISTTIEVDSYPIRRIGSSQYVVSTRQNRTFMYKTRQAMIHFPSHLNGYYYEEKKGSYGPQFSEAHSKASQSIPQKEKDPGSFTLPCFIINVCFDNSLVDLGASVSVMPLSTYLNLGLGKLVHTKLTVELTDRTVKYPKGITKNVLVGIGKFVFPIDFIILDMPEDIKVPLILGRPFLSTARAKIDVYKRRITLRVEEERIVFTSVKPASSLIKKVYMLSFRERMELDLEARIMRETLVLNRSLDHFLEDYIKLNDLNEPFELRRNQGDDLMPTIEEGEVIEEFRTRDDELDTKNDDYPRSGNQQKEQKPSQMNKTEHGMEKTVQNQGQSPKMPKSESILKNTIGCNLNPSDGPGKPNSIIMKTVKTKWALNQFQQPICVQLTKTVKTLKAQS
ncbi:mitochondrial proton/calcium exchanger protein-like protein isoform X1 [Tanacetum coccineum]|uniref:Mitochondrial proton/calcium exchanger protein-like protein isoform X1 n=1 Tax=Tanacetum coccineum TaxID=301880 RepID=A0ABQ5EYY5_9ASTR